MKVVLANMPWKKGNRSGVRAGSRWPHMKDHTEEHYLPVPFYLAYAAALLNKNGFEVQIIDAVAEQLSYRKFFQKLICFKPKLLVVETSTVTLKHDLRLLLKYKGKFSIVLCGPEAHLSEERILEREQHIDYVLFGEYEASLLELVTFLAGGRYLKDVKGLMYRRNGNVVKNAPRPLISDLDWLPWPLREQLPLRRYNDTPGDIPAPCASMWASRGCPFHCSFCLWPQVMYHGNSYRVRNIVCVVDEMEYLVKTLGFKSIYFDDDTWNVGRERILAFCEELQSRNLRIPWAIMARAELMDEELLERMREAGLFAVKYGVESSSQKLLNTLGKGTDLKKLEEVIHYTKYLGIRTHLTFTFGLLGENKKTVRDTIDYAKKLNPTSVQFSLATPFPGTRFYEQMKERGYILTQDWDKFDGNHSSVVRTAALSGKDLEQAKKTAYREWEEFCRLRLQRLKSPKRITLREKLVVSFRNDGFLRTGIRALRYIIRRLFFIPLWLRQMFMRHSWIVEESISDGDLKVCFGEGKAVVYWRGRQISENVGMNTSLYCEDRWIDSSRANWKLEKQSPRRITLKLKWDEKPVRQEWDVWIENNSVFWSLRMQIDRKVDILEYKSGIMLKKEYTLWKDDVHIGRFPRIKGWEEIELYNPNSALLTAMSENRHRRHTLPQVTLTAVGGLADNAYPQIQNSDKKTNARILQMRKLNISSFSPGTYDYFALEMNVGLPSCLPVQAISDYRKKVPLRFLREKVNREGMIAVLKKIVRYCNIEHLKDYYGDIVGVLDGAYAYRGPPCVQIDLTNNCNNNCIGCWCNSPLLKDRKIKESIKQQTLPFAVVKKTVDELCRMGTKEIYFAGGGEPFMHPRIMEIIEYVKSKGLRCYINTNFTLLDERMIRRLAALKADNLVISIWAGTAKTYCATHPNKSEATFLRIKKMLTLLNSLKQDLPRTNVYNVISNVNYQELEQMVDFALDTRSDSLEFTVIDTIPGATDALMLSDEQREAVVRSCGRIQAKLDSGLKNRIQILQFAQFIRRVSNPDARCAEYDKNILADMPCYIGWLFARILADGNVNFCLKAHRIPVGNIYAQDFASLWNSARQREFRGKALSAAKDDVFFSFIGNDPDAKAGCFKGCDDLARNVHMHKKIQSLTSVERIFLRWLLLLIKAHRYMRKQPFSEAIRARLERVKNDSRNVLKQDKLRIIAHKEGVKLYWKDTELTQNVGLNTSIRVFGLWHDSSKAHWEILRRSENELVVKNIWKNIPITQEWRVTVTEQYEISWKVRLFVDSKIKVEEKKAGIMLSPSFKKWATQKEEGTFPATMSWKEVALHDESARLVAVTATRWKEDHLPGVRLDFSENALPFMPQVQNSDRFINARIISAKHIAAKEAAVLLPGEYDMFSAKIHVKTDEQ